MTCCFERVPQFLDRQVPYSGWPLPSRRKGYGGMDVLIERCAGLDVHRDSVVATVRRPGAGGGRRSETQSLLVNDVGDVRWGGAGSDLITVACRAGHERGLLVAKE